MDAMRSLSVTERSEQLTSTESIRRLVTKRMFDVLYELEKDEKLSQGELARRINAKPAALSNLLLKFEDVNPKLIKREYKGQYCYCSLTDCGRRFMEDVLKAGGAPDKKSSALLDREDNMLFQAAVESLESFEREYGDSWYLQFDNVLVYYMQGSKIVPDKKATQLTTQYLRSLELLKVHQNDRLFIQTLALLACPTNRCRVVSFIDNFFEPLGIVLQTLREGGRSLQVTMSLHFIFTGKQGELARKYMEDLGWSGEPCYRLAKAAEQIKQRLQGESVEDIYNFLTALLPDQDMLSASISQYLYSQIK